MQLVHCYLFAAVSIRFLLYSKLVLSNTNLLLTYVKKNAAIVYKIEPKVHVKRQRSAPRCSQTNENFENKELVILF